MAAADAPGLNYGWNTMEGTHCFDPPSGCDSGGLEQPVLEYSHDDGCSITGGFVYRGEAVPALQGRYLYADWCGGWVRSFEYDDGAADIREHATDVGRPVSFGVDGAGEMYMLTGGGSVFKVTGDG